MLSETQLNILETYTEIQLESVRELLPVNIILALKSIEDNRLYNENSEILETIDIKDIVDNWREVFAHPYPQNRSTSALSGHDNEEAYYRNAGCNWQHEPRGLLSLTSSNDNSAQYVTRADVTRYFRKLIANEIIAAERIIAGQAAQNPNNINTQLAYLTAQIGIQNYRINELMAVTKRLTLGEHLGARNSARTGDVYKLEERDIAADKKHTESCNTRMKYGTVTTGIGIAMQVTSCIFPPSAPILWPAGSAMTGLSSLYTGKKFIDKKVGRTGNYVDIFTMAQSSLGENGKKVCDQLLKDIENRVTKLIIDGAKTIIYDNNPDDNERQQKEPNRDKVFATLKAIYESKACPATGIKDFDNGLINGAKILADLKVMYNAIKNTCIKEPELDILNPHDYFVSFKKLSIENREEVIESVNNLLVSSLKKLETSIRLNERLIKIEARVREAKTESCVVM